jgi:hypothetical protein
MCVRWSYLGVGQLFHRAGTVIELRLFGRQDVADEYELLLSYFPNLDLESVSKEVLLGAAALRAS